eukprot:scaffold629712_cov23-Prasinocladus_malaysianus.AAC.1
MGLPSKPGVALGSHSDYNCVMSPWPTGRSHNLDCTWGLSFRAWAHGRACRQMIEWQEEHIGRVNDHTE